MNKRDDLLKEIGLGLETMADKIRIALAGRDEPTGSRAEWEGVAAEPLTDAKEALLRVRFPEACLTLCHLSALCPNRFYAPMGGGYCLLGTVCAEHPDAPAPAVPCCTKSSPCERHKTAEPDLLQGYTPEQWGEIIKGGYLCEFSNVTNDGAPDWKKPVARLVEVGRKWGNGRSDIIFTSESEKEYTFCRPAQLPGVLRPWFGGECPVDKDATVLAVLGNGHTIVKEAGVLEWGGVVPRLPHITVTSYMEV
jgi:hypothetical protein